MIGIDAVWGYSSKQWTVVSHWSVNYREAFFPGPSSNNLQVEFRTIPHHLITSRISDPTTWELFSFLIYSENTSGVAYPEVLVN